MVAASPTQITSSPPRPRMRSPPPPPTITSGPAVPVRISPLGVPTMVATRPSHVGGGGPAVPETVIVREVILTDTGPWGGLLVNASAMIQPPSCPSLQASHALA